MESLRTLWKGNATYIAGCVLIALVCALISLSSRGISITNQSFDILRTTPVRDEAVIIAIDDKSLQAIGSWPWDRDVFAALTEKVISGGAKSVIYDVLFLEPRQGDEEFKTVLSETDKPVILAAKLDQGTYLSSYLLASTTLAYSALANVDPDRDGKVRAYAGSSIIGGSCVVGLAEAGFNVATFKTPICKQEAAMFRYPKTITTYSLTDVLTGVVPENVFTQKTVFVGATALDLFDTFVGMNGEKIPGVYVHASQFVSKLNGVHDVPISRTISILWFAFFGLLISILFRRVRNMTAQIFILIGIAASLIIISVILFNQGHITPWLISLVMLFLIAGFASLLHTFEERKKNAYIESLFSKYVHKDVLKELMKSSANLRFDGERRDMTILFSDLRGFTTISEKMQPEELTGLLNAYFSAMTPAILEEKGTIDKFIGDAIMAFWNAPLVVEDHPRHAVHAALRMGRALTKFNESTTTPLAMGVGVHRGEVIVGNVGSDARVNYTILGDAVNLASRIEGLTKKYGVTCIVTDIVRNAVDDETIGFRKLDVITVKGKSEPSVLYEAYFIEDGDANTVSSYEQAFVLYEAGDFDKAETIFKTLASAGDGPSKTMLERLPLLRKAEVWDGVWHFDEK
jgi:adenylate cyclase